MSNLPEEQDEFLSDLQRECDFCGQHYHPSGSEAKSPQRYCSARCERYDYLTDQDLDRPREDDHSYYGVSRKDF